MYYYPNLEYTINYVIEPNSEIVKPLTQSEYRAELCKSYIKSLVKNPQDVDLFGSNVQNITKNNKVAPKSETLQRVKSLSVLDEITPDYIIITNNALKPTFQTLADWKTKKGIFTIIMTVEEIGQFYKGSDLPEKIRNYLIDCKNKWGDGLFILLGGDLSIVPSRFVAGCSDDLTYPTDKYYSTSNYWSYSNNIFYGSSTALTINYTGRVPVSNTQESNNYIGKLIAYEHTTQISDLSYYKNILIADAFMLRCLENRSTNGKSTLKSYRDNYLAPLSLNAWLMFDDYNCTRTNQFYYADGNSSTCCYDGDWPVYCPGGTCITGDDEFSKNNFIAALNTGGASGYGNFHIIYHMDHAGPRGMGTSGKDKGESINITDFDGLNNGLYYQIMMSGGCHPANFANDCMGKHYLINQDKGGVTFIGNTDVGYVSEYTQFEPFCKALYKTGGFIDNGRYDIGSIFQYVLGGGWRLHLLGDPEMQVWTGVPAVLTPTLSTTSVTLGSQNVSITISGLATGSKATICLWKGDEIYISQTVTGNGTYSIPFTANSVGTIYVTVTAHNFKPYEGTITVNQTAAPNLSVSTVDFGDGITQGLGYGNANGQNDAGETINLTLGIKNTGVNTANNVTATLSSSSPFISITSNQGSFGNIASGVTSTSNQFNYIIRRDAPGKDANGVVRSECLTNDASPITLVATIKDVNNTTWTHNFNIDVFKDSLIQCGKKILSTFDGDMIIEPNETVTMNIDLENICKGTTKGLSALLTSTASSTIIQSCSNSLREYPAIAQFEVKPNNTVFQFTTGANYSVNNLSSLTFNLNVTNAYGKTWNFPFNLSQPAQVSANGIEFTADLNEIDLKWTNVISAIGYNIYRCDVGTNDTEVGAYEKLNSVPVTFTFYNDTKNLNTLTKYYYKITAIKSDGNESEPTRKLAWTSYPKKFPFPVAMDNSLGSISTSINVVDVNGDGKKEIFAGMKGGNDKGFLIGLDYLGNELYNIDNNLTTYSGFAKLGKAAWAIPAIGDLNRIGKNQIIEPTREYGAGLENAVFCYSIEDTNPADGKPDLLWSNYTTEKQYLKGVIISNIDNSPDGSMEIVTTSDERGSISVYNSQGMQKANIATTNTYGYIAVADLDGNSDGKKEIIHTANNEIYVWCQDGSNYRGYNPLYSTPLSGYRFLGSPVVCDIDNDGNKDILGFAIQQNSGGASIAKLFGVKNDGTVITGFNGNITINTNCDWYQDLSVGDLDNDGNLEIVTLAKNEVRIWNNQGQSIISIPFQGLEGGEAPILADVNGDNLSEIIFAKDNLIYAYKIDGNIALGFPLRSSETSCGGLCVSDIDGDNKNEILAGASSKIEVWQTDGLPSKIEWGHDRHDQYNTGEYYSVCEPTYITTSTTWSNNQSLCNDVIIKSGNLTINNNSNISMPLNSMVIVMAGATLTIDSGKILNCNVKVLTGGTLILKNNGVLDICSNGELTIEQGGIFENQYGSIE